MGEYPRAQGPRTYHGEFQGAPSWASSEASGCQDPLPPIRYSESINSPALLAGYRVQAPLLSRGAQVPTKSTREPVLQGSCYPLGAKARTAETDPSVRAPCWAVWSPAPRRLHSLSPGRSGANRSSQEGSEEVMFREDNNLDSKEFTTIMREKTVKRAGWERIWGLPGSTVWPQRRKLGEWAAP